MSAGWVAGSVRARLLLEHRAGVQAALRVAQAGSLAEALTGLAGTVYAPLPAGASLEEAQRAIAVCTAPRIRVLAAWLPPGGAVGLRSLAAWFELVNIEDRLAYLAGAELRAPFELGVLASVWDAVASAQSGEAIRALLASSSWGDPRGSDTQAIQLGLRFGWARRVAATVPEARPWAAGAAALLLAAEVLLAGRTVDPELARRAGLGIGWADVTTVAELQARLPACAAWALAGVAEPPELRHAELRWWRRVEANAEEMVRGRLDGSTVVVGAVALLALDAVRIGTALAAAARGGSEAAIEVLDALC